MIKICYIIGQLNKAGAESQLYELLKGIDRNRFNPIVISLSDNGYWANKIKNLNIEVVELKRKKNKEFTRLIRLVKLLNNIKPDIVHTYLSSANFYGRIAAIVNKVPIIIASERNLPDIGKDKNINQIFIDKLLALRTTAIICNSQIGAETLIKKYSYKRDKVFTVHNGINRIRISNEKQTLRKNAKLNWRIVTVGWFRPQKNHRLFFDMAKLVLERSKNENLKFVLIGDGVLRHNLENYSQSLGIAKNIIFAGKRHKVLELLKSKDIFVLTSLYEGLCNAIMEAMMVGLPVVATNVGGNSELVIDGKTGFLCPSGNADALADKVCYLLNNEYKAKRLGENGRVRILSEFGVDNMQKKTQDIYLDLLHKQNKIPLI